MAKLFFLLSGEHPTLPFSELESILDAEELEYEILERLTQVLRLKASINSVKSVTHRSAMTRVGCLELFSCNAAFAEISASMYSATLDGVLGEGNDFAVRVRRVKASAPHLVGVELERNLGEIILRKINSSRVNLSSPQKTFFGVLTDNRFVLGLKIAEISPKPFVERRPRKRPFFHPTAMPAKLARCMVNLAQPKRGDLVLDPFCGTASILVEAGLIGCHVAGFDVQLRMVKGSLQNLTRYGVEPEGMAVADALNPPTAEVDCIVTDPPYGRSATTLGWNTQRLVEAFLSRINNMLPRSRRICMASPKSIGIGKIGRDYGFKHVESHFVHVHRSLTREIAVFERT